jgi:hypothetical protein
MNLFLWLQWDSISTVKDRDLCKTPPFAQSQRQAQILILKILHVFLWLKFSPFLVLNKIERFSKVSTACMFTKIVNLFFRET